MKKILLMIILLTAIAIRIDFKEAYADGTALGLDFDVPENEWGTYKNKSTRSYYTPLVNKGDTYYVGNSKLEAAIYEHATDSDYVLVIVRAMADPYDLEIYYNWLFGKEPYDGVIDDVQNTGPLDIYKSYNSTDERISFTYDYDCTYTCDNHDNMAYNNGMYLVKKSQVYHGSTGEFITTVQGGFTRIMIHLYLVMDTKVILSI